MSPTENDLRAALRHGEGDGPDAESIIAAGRAVRGRRRAVLLSAAAVVVVGGGVASGVALTSGSGTDQRSAAGSAGSAQRPASSAGQKADGAAGGAAGGAVTNAPTAVPTSPAAPATGSGSSPDTVPGVTCPASPPQYVRVPGGPRGGDPLFPDSVRWLLLCSYYDTEAPGAATRPKPVVLTGANATTLVESMEKAPKQRRPEMCPNYRPADERTLVVIAFDAGNRPVATVTTTVGGPACAVTVTNGTAIRYNWAPPASIASLINAVRPPGGRTPVASETTLN